jgi:hypothetical protein
MMKTLDFTKQMKFRNFSRCMWDASRQQSLFCCSSIGASFSAEIII